VRWAYGFGVDSADHDPETAESAPALAEHEADQSASTEATKPRIRADEAQRRLIDATIEIIRERPFQEATARAVADVTGLHRSTIERNFGSMTGLYKAVAYELSDRYAEFVRTVPVEEASAELILHPDVQLRTRLVAWLVTQGVGPKEIAVDPEREISALLTARNIRMGVDPSAAWLFTQMMIYMIEGFTIMGETHDRREGDLRHGLELIQKLRDDLPRTAKELWPDGLEL
jgi:AcrR family transcriptional regulator